MSGSESVAVPAGVPPALGEAASVMRIGCVSFLNSKPLIEGIVGQPDASVRFDVPSRLLADLERGDVEVALCPVIDYYRSRVPLVVLPVGGICSRGRTLTVRLFSRTPIHEIQSVHADTDSHTSVALVQVLLKRELGRRVPVVSYRPPDGIQGDAGTDHPNAMLLIGDKVVTDSPAAVIYPWQLDLGEKWASLTGLPFMFAVWMAREGGNTSRIAARLAETREHNAGRIDSIVDRYARSHGWPADLARTYLGSLLHYSVGQQELAAMEQFAKWAHELGLIDQPAPLRLHT